MTRNTPTKAERTGKKRQARTPHEQSFKSDNPQPFQTDPDSNPIDQQALKRVPKGMKDEKRIERFLRRAGKKGDRP